MALGSSSTVLSVSFDRKTLGYLTFLPGHWIMGSVKYEKGIKEFLIM